MNVNSQPLAPVIKDWLNSAKYQIQKAGSPSPKLDAEIILSHVLKNERTYLHAHGSDLLNSDDIFSANKFLEMRIKRVPIAYIVGYKEFYGRKFLVTPVTLIPRPESEDIIEILHQILPTSDGLNLIDIGTGSGCLGITVKHEFPKLNVILSDISNATLKIAAKNAKVQSINVKIIKSDLLQNVHEKIDIIIANLPYVDKSWNQSPENKYEPEMALYADNTGLSIIYRLIDQAKKLLLRNGYLIIEADPIQHKSIIEYAKNNNFDLVSKINYVIAFRLNNLSNRTVKH